jgi:hypothetical protein
MAECGGENAGALRDAIENRKLTNADDYEEIYDLALKMGVGCKRCLVVRNANSCSRLDKENPRKDYPAFFSKNFSDPSFNPYDPNKEFMGLIVTPHIAEHKAFKDFTGPELEAAEWAYIRKTLEKCQEKLVEGCDCGAQSWIGPAIDICKDRAQEIRKKEEESLLKTELAFPPCFTGNDLTAKSYFDYFYKQVPPPPPLPRFRCHCNIKPIFDSSYSDWPPFAVLWNYWDNAKGGIASRSPMDGLKFKESKEYHYERKKPLPKSVFLSLEVDGKRIEKQIRKVIDGIMDSSWLELAAALIMKKTEQ